MRTQDPKQKNKVYTQKRHAGREKDKKLVARMPLEVHFFPKTIRSARLDELAFLFARYTRQPSSSGERIRILVSKVSSSKPLLKMLFHG